MELASDSIIEDYKLSFETLPNLPALRFTKKMNKFEKLFGNYLTQKLMQRYISDCFIQIAKKIFLIILIEIYKIVNILEIRINRMGPFL